MADLEAVGRLAFRQEGGNWAAYYALPHDMAGAVPLGSIRMAAVIANPERKQAFIDLMRDVVADILEIQIGSRPIWTAPTAAPEHERSGEA
jgi:hypothetical protein